MARHARVATFPPGVDLPEVVAAERTLTLVRRPDGSVLSIALFDDEETARRAGAAGDAYVVATDHRRADRDARYARVSVHVGNPMRDVSAAPLYGLEGLAEALMLIDRRSGDGLGILLFDTEESLERGHEHVSKASPGTAGTATHVAFYEVAAVA